jgi:hypothetical protein
MTICRLLTAVLLVAQAGLVEHDDPQGRFRISVPQRYGAITRGTNDGFGDRVAALRFAAFPAPLGGEAVLTRGFPLLDLQTAGGLYDALTLEVLPANLKALVVSRLTRLSNLTFCGAIARPSHVDVGGLAFQALSVQQREAIQRLDAMRNVDPRVMQCRVEGGVIVFHKEVSFQVGGPRQHLFGALRFLDGEYSTFQFIAGGEAPQAALLDEMAGVVRSFTASRPR